MEIWRDVLGYEGIYIVSDAGRVIRTAGWTDGRKIPIRGEITPEKTKQGRYRRVTLFRDRTRRRFGLHTVVYEAFCGKMPPQLEINHKNGKPWENHLENLEAVTHLRNVRHAIEELDRNSYMARGSKHWNAKLTERRVAAMRQMRAEGIKVKEIATHFGANLETAREAINGKSWKHVHCGNGP